jgi:hypothetical protein
MLKIPTLFFFWAKILKATMKCTFYLGVVARWVINNNNYWNDFIKLSGQSLGSFHGDVKDAFDPGEKARGCLEDRLWVWAQEDPEKNLTTSPLCFDWSSLITCMVWPEIRGIILATANCFIVKFRPWEEMGLRAWATYSPTMWMCVLLKLLEPQFCFYKVEIINMPHLCQRDPVKINKLMNEKVFANKRGICQGPCLIQKSKLLVFTQKSWKLCPYKNPCMDIYKSFTQKCQ